MTDLRFPIGEFVVPSSITPATRNAAIDSIKALPGLLVAALSGLSDDQLDTPYRPDGWTVRQVAHHLPDSHLNAYARTKIGLTEEQPVIRTYEEALWANLPDSGGPVDTSLDLLKALCVRWVLLFRALDDAQWKATFHHPELGGMTIEQQVCMYAWHGEHHVAHITSLRGRRGW